jgi:nitroreductase
LLRLVDAATCAPSPTNRQPWRFSVVTSRAMREHIVETTQEAIDEIRSLIARSGHPDHLLDYWGYFTRPLASAPAFVVTQYRETHDIVGNLVEAGGGDRASFCTSAQWHAELSAASAATMQLLLQAHAEGLGACWMSGPLLARPKIAQLLRIQPPWQILGGVAVGWPAERPQATGRKPLDKVIEWFEDAAP